MPVTQFEDPKYLEAVYAALLTQLKTAAFAGGLTLNSSSRAVEIPDKVPTADQPALRLVNGPMRVEQKEFGLAKWTITAVAAVYMRADGSSDPNVADLAATNANYVVWGLAQALQPPGTPQQYEKQTLGGLVYHCWIEGEVFTEVQAQQIVIAVPIFILAGPSG